jgi:hypothetical protein
MQPSAFVLTDGAGNEVKAPAELVKKLGYILASFERRNNVLLEGHLRVGNMTVWFKLIPRADEAARIAELLKQKKEEAMALSLDQAQTLEIGTKLRFGKQDHVFEVVGFEDRGPGLHMLLLRDDGYETHATQHDLDVAVIHGKPPELTIPVESDPDETLVLPPTKKGKGKG